MIFKTTLKYEYPGNQINESAVILRYPDSFGNLYLLNIQDNRMKFFHTIAIIVRNKSQQYSP